MNLDSTGETLESLNMIFPVCSATLFLARSAWWLVTGTWRGMHVLWAGGRGGRGGRQSIIKPPVSNKWWSMFSCYLSHRTVNISNIYLDNVYDIQENLMVTTMPVGWPTTLVKTKISQQLFNWLLWHFWSPKDKVYWLRHHHEVTFVVQSEMSWQLSDATNFAMCFEGEDKFW